MDQYQHTAPVTEPQHLTEASLPPTSDGAPLNADIVVLLSREAILARRGQTKRELVQVRGWGGAVYVKAMTGSERDSFEESMGVTKKDGTREITLKNLRAKLVARTAVDAEGRHLFTPADIASLGELDATDLQTVFEVAQRLSGMTEADVDELTGKSEDAPSDANIFA